MFALRLQLCSVYHENIKLCSYFSSQHLFRMANLPILSENTTRMKTQVENFLTLLILLTVCVLGPQNIV